MCFCEGLYRFLTSLNHIHSLPAVLLCYTFSFLDHSNWPSIARVSKFWRGELSKDASKGQRLLMSSWKQRNVILRRSSKIYEWTPRGRRLKHSYNRDVLAWTGDFQGLAYLDRAKDIYFNSSPSIRVMSNCDYDRIHACTEALERIECCSTIPYVVSLFSEDPQLGRLPFSRSLRSFSIDIARFDVRLLAPSRIPELIRTLDKFEFLTELDMRGVDVEQKSADYSPLNLLGFVILHTHFLFLHNIICVDIFN